MTISLRHIILLVGMALLILSFLFFGGGTSTYDLLLFSGFIIAVISYMTILIKKDTLKNKIFWTLALIILIAIQRLIEPLLIEKSYGLFITQNQTRLTKLNQLILTKRNGLLLMPKLDTNASKDFTTSEINQIHSLTNGTTISLIEKDSSKIFYRTYGMLDVSNGIFYFYNTDNPDERFKHIYGNWYY